MNRTVNETHNKLSQHKNSTKATSIQVNAAKQNNNNKGAKSSACLAKMRDSRMREK